MPELPFLHSARRLMLIDIYMKFREYSLSGFQVIERTRFVTDRQDRRTGQTPGEKQYVSRPWRGEKIVTQKKALRNYGVTALRNYRQTKSSIAPLFKAGL